ncbi:MAG: SpoIIE family protein phosphatase [Christensenellaceae bacterium]
MNERKKFNFSTVLLYILLFIAMFALYYVGGNGEPFSLALLYAMLAAGLNPVVSCLLYALSGLSGFTLHFLPVYAGQAAILCIVFCVYAKLKKKASVLPLACVALSLALFVAFSPFTPYNIPLKLPFSLGAITQKIILSGLILLLSAMFTVALKALFNKLLRCRLKAEEIIFSVLFFVLCGVGICRIVSVTAYMGIAFLVLLLFACATKDASALVCAFALSLPSAFVGGVSPERFFVYGIAVVLFIKMGRLPAVLALLAVFFAYGYFDGIYALKTSLLVQSILSALIPSLLFLLIPSPLVRKMENKLVFYREKHLSRIAINRNRAAIGEQLFEISGVFREIQTTFAALSTNEAEEGAKEYIRGCVIESVCKSCANYRTCMARGLENGLNKLIDVGCAKGKTSLIDIPSDLAESCVNQSGVLYAVNRQIGDYRKYMLETENAASGRQLLANQAQGVSEILKNIALEQSEPLTIYSEKEKQLNVALLKAGIVCSEVLIAGDEDSLTLSLVTFGKADVKKIAAIASHVLAAPLIISERLTLSKDKFCCILHRKPYFDAAFGVATLTKTGEIASGDTHSVIKIDERRFMIALSDGMGSGEYARRISESTISLLESFYRAKMPSSLVLSTINKLLTFSREETFACVDIAVVDLDNGEADIVKIGSPMGFILSGNALHILESASLPLGILESLHPDTSSYTLQEDDVLLFLSDGITSAFGSSSDLYETLKNIPASNPQQLADALLAKAVALYGGTAKDDMTVLAVRLFKSLSEAV